MKIFNNAPSTSHQIEQNKVDRAQDKARTGNLDKTRGADSKVPVEISDEAKLMGLAREIATSAPDSRQDRIEALKQAISQGTYKVDAAKVADRLVDEHVAIEFGKNNL